MKREALRAFHCGEVSITATMRMTIKMKNRKKMLQNLNISRTQARNKMKPSVTQRLFELRLTFLKEGSIQLIVNQDWIIGIDNSRRQPGHGRTYDLTGFEACRAS